MPSPSRSKPARKPARQTPGKSARPKAATSVESLVPVLTVDDAAKAIDWYKRAFGAREDVRKVTPEGKVLHAELRLGKARVFLADAFLGAATEHPTALGGTSVKLHLDVEAVDRAWALALTEGAVVTSPLEDREWGERHGELRDPFGHVWSMSSPMG